MKQHIRMLFGCHRLGILFKRNTQKEF